jgi:hypothetical protein
MILARTTQFVIAGVYNEEMHPSIAAEAIEKLADYFRKKGK